LTKSKSIIAITINFYYSESNKLSLLIRHADRDKIPAGSFGNEVMLNEAGKINALNFGETLSDLKINKC
jgi:hypothetical protein